MSEELDIPATLAKLEMLDLSTMERILAGHTGTVVLLLSLYFNKPVEVVVIDQQETSLGHLTSEYKGEIHRRVELVAGGQVVATASTVIPINKNGARVLGEVRRRELGLGHIAVKLQIPTARTIICVEATDGELSRTYVMQGPGLYYTITETFPRALYRPTVHPERWAPAFREAAGGKEPAGE